MKNVKIWFYDNNKIGSDGRISFTKTIDVKLGAKQVAAITDKFDNAVDNKHMFKALSAKLRVSKKYAMSEKQIENALNPAKKFFKVDHLVITHLEVIDIKGKKFVAAVASRVKRDSLGNVAKIIDRRVFWFGCRFQVDALTRDVKITCSTSAGVKPYFSILSEDKEHANGTSFRSTTIKRVESDEVINEYDRKKPVTEERKQQLKTAKETFKAKKLSLKETKKAIEEIKETALAIDAELESYAGEVESFEDKQSQKVLVDSEMNDIEATKEQECYIPASNIDELRAKFMNQFKPNNWDEYVSHDDEIVEISDEEREQMEREADELHYELYGTVYGSGVRLMGGFYG